MITIEELFQTICNVIPYGSIEQDSDGQIVIYTGWALNEENIIVEYVPND